MDGLWFQLYSVDKKMQRICEKRKAQQCQWVLPSPVRFDKQHFTAMPTDSASASRTQIDKVLDLVEAHIVSDDAAS